LKVTSHTLHYFVSSNTEVLKRVLKPRIDRVLRGEVTLAKYNPANLADLAGVSLKDVLEAVRGALEDLYGPLSKSQISSVELREAGLISRSKVVVSPLQA